MKTTDLRNATFASLRQSLNDARKKVYQAWVVHGPGTTREVAEKSCIDLLTFRPRTTDLYEIGLVKLYGADRGIEGVYAAVPEDQWESWRRGAISTQMQLI